MWRDCFRYFCFCLYKMWRNMWDLLFSFIIHDQKWFLITFSFLEGLKFRDKRFHAACFTCVYCQVFSYLQLQLMYTSVLFIIFYGCTEISTILKLILQVNLADRKGEFILTEEGLQCNNCVRWFLTDDCTNLWQKRLIKKTITTLRSRIEEEQGMEATSDSCKVHCPVL